MRLHGVHHITAITADAQKNIDFYAGLLGLRFVKKTVNFDAPELYHLYFADQVGNPGSVLTFFEYRGADRGRAGQGMIHRLVWRVGSDASLDFWQQRLKDAGYDSARSDTSIVFEDFEGLGLELLIDESDDEPLTAKALDIPEEHALRGFEGVRAYSALSDRSDALLSAILGFEREGDTFTLSGNMTSTYVLDPAPESPGFQGAGTVHHIAWACDPPDQPAWRERVASAGAQVTPIIDRQYFKSIYFREPSGVLFEIATIGPGFIVDESLEHLGEELRLPPQHEHLRAHLERVLVPVHDPHA